MEGLTTREAKIRLKKYGFNEIKRKEKINPLKILLSQFTSPLIITLIVAAVASWAIGFLPGQDSNLIDTFLILLIVLVSGVSGFFQDYKAEKTIEALQKISTPHITAIRDGKEKSINVKKLVVGDLILLSEGDVVPADCKLIETFNLELDESTLTGESSAVKKNNGQEVFKGTFVNSGHAKALVVKTGMSTKLGNIAGKIQKMQEEQTLFQREISKFSKKILYLIISIISIIFVISLFKYDLYQSILLSISLAVAAIPEGLPAILILVLAIGAKVMASKNALVRKLSVVESSGAIDVICTDKTGTLTKNEMTVKRIFVNNKDFEISKIRKEEVNEIKDILLCGRLCNNSKIRYSQNKKVYLGDQTEIALRKVYDKFFREEEYKKIGEISFSSDRKIMSTIYEKYNKKFVFSKGAPEVLIKKCKRISINGKITPMNKKQIKTILEKNNEFASEALRVLGFAYKEIRDKSDPEEDLIWIGLQAMIDPPNPEVKQALRDCKTAGIRVIILTGDNPATASAIAKEIEFKIGGVVTGDELDKLSDRELDSLLQSGVNIFARISPFHKLKILEVLKKRYRVAMTGDGVNDALALKKADVGISVGRGTEVAKQASDIILLDNNFASIVSAVKEGRRSFDNIRKFINYLFVCNLAEVGVIFFATLFFTLSDPILLPIQLLWINLLTDGLPALALGVDPARPDIMKKPPRKKDEPLVNKKLSWLIGSIGIKKIIILLATFLLVQYVSGVEQARAALFTGFILYEFVRIGTIRSQEKLTWFSNKWLLWALFVSIVLQLLIVYTPLNSLFHIAPLGLYAWLVLFGGIIIGYTTAIIITRIITRFVKD